MTSTLTKRGSHPEMPPKDSQSERSPEPGAERRADLRFQIHVPLSVRWKSVSGDSEDATESQNVSSRGILFLSSKPIEEGSPVEIVMTLPPEITMAGPIKVRCHGRIRRTESRLDRRVGVVAEIESYEFLRSDADSQSRELHTERVRVSLPVSLSGVTRDGKPINEKGETVVGRHGALLRTPACLVPGTTLEVMNGHTHEVEKFRVAWVGAEPRDGLYDVGLEILTPREDFWGMRFPR